MQGSTAMAKISEAQQRANRRLGWILASVALVFALGFVAKIAFMGH